MSMQLMEQAAVNALGSNHVAMLHPGRALVASNFYANPSSSEHDILKAEVLHGRYKQSANTLNFGATSQFQIPPNSILSNCWLTATVTVPIMAGAPAGWFLNSIASIEYQFAGSSNMNQIQLSGDSHWSLIMAACQTKEKRDGILAASPAIVGGAAAATYTVACPLYLPWSSSNTEDKFPVDSAALQGNIIVNIRWRPNYEVFSGYTANALTGPSAFDSVNLTAKQINLMEQAFRVSNMIKSDPTVTYVIPTNHAQTFTKEVSVTAGSIGTITLDSLPKGQLVGIFVKARSIDSFGNSLGLTPIHPAGVVFNYTRLRHNGQDIIFYESEQEAQLVRLIENNGNGYQLTIGQQTGAAATHADITSEVCVLPLSYDLAHDMSSRHSEAVPDYGGNILEFQFRTAATTGTYRFDFCYLFNAVIEISNSAIAMAL